MSAIDNSEVGDRTSDEKTAETFLSNALRSNATTGRSAEAYRIRTPKRILHFSDGTLEEFDDTEDESDQENEDVERRFQKALREENQLAPVNPKTLSWPAWIHHYTSTTGQKTLSILDNIGENIAYYLGITTPKYQYEIDEYNRASEEAMAKKKEKEIELNSWATPSVRSAGSNEPIISDIIQRPDP